MIATRPVLIAAALGLSLCLHLALFYWFTDIHVGSFAIPGSRLHLPPPLHLKRVEIPPSDLEPVAATPVPPPQPMENAPVRLPEAQTPLPQSLPSAPPPEPGPAPGNPENFAPIAPAPPSSSSPYVLGDRARIDAELSKLDVGPTLPSLPVLQPTAPPTPGASTSLGEDLAGQGGEGTAPNVSALPTLDQVTARFRVPPPTLDPRLPQPVVLALPTDILFDFDSSTLRPGADPVLRQALTYIEKYPRADIEIDGHTDSFGTEAYNLDLSQERAEAVADWLRHYLAASSYALQTRGFGFSRPVVSTAGTVAAQQKNRRVEIIVRALAPEGDRPTEQPK
jgi:outer membrane protein OmpA-like peptidoglycan-associated protein